MPLNIEHIYNCLQNFNFADLFIKDFGWNPPLKSREIDIDESHVRREIARLADVPLLEIKTINGEIPDAQVRADLYKKLSAFFPKTLLIFIDNTCTRSIWYWIKNDGKKTYKREYHYFKGQPGDGFLSKFDSMVKDLGISDEMIGVSELAERLKLPVNQLFYKRFDEQRVLFLNSISGIDEEQDRQWYASILLNRLIFTYFLEKRGFLDGDVSYLEYKLKLSSEVHPEHYYDEFLLTLFFKMFAKYSDISSNNSDVFLGHIPYLNDSLPMPHPIELRYPDIHIPDSAFEELFSFFSSYSWSLVDIPDGKDYEINPHVLSYLFELYIKQKTLASYYIRGEITDYLCKQTMHRLILSRVNRQPMSGVSVGRHFDSLEEMLTKLDAPLCHKLLFDILPGLSLLDPACGSGFFLLAALRSLVDIYGVVVSRIQYLEDANLFKWYQEKSALYPDITYYLKQKVITENLFGVDILEEATEITRLQLLLALFTSIHTSDQIKPLSDINFNISAGNSLIGLLRLEDYPYKDVRPSEALANLDKLLLDQINNPLLKKLNKKARNKQTFEDIKPLKPFHWGYKFGQIMNEHGGFDLIITDPPWKILRSLDQYSNFLRSNPQYEYQGVENLNLYKLFVERCYKLLCDDGQCGILVPNGIVSDYNTQQLREMLFNKTCITSLFTFENRRHILSGVDSRFKFALLTFYKGGSTKTFPASFNRFNVEELTYFPSEGSISIPVTLIRLLSPDICSIAEFRSTIDMQICEKMARYPFLDERMDDRWNVVLTQDIHMTHNHRILHAEPGADYLPLYEGKMIQQFIPQTVQPRYWVKEADGRAAILGHELDKGQRLDYQSYRLGYRTIVGSNDERTLVATVLPPNVFAGNTLNVTDKSLPAQNLLFLLALLNSFVVDFMIRLHVSAHITMHDVYQLPIPRLVKDDAAFLPIVERAARIMCITPEFKDLWNMVMPVPWSSKVAATTFADRVRIRAELDGLIAHLYDLTEEQFTYLLATFPFVPEPVRVTTHNAYRDVERGLIK